MTEYVSIFQREKKVQFVFPKIYSLGGSEFSMCIIFSGPIYYQKGSSNYYFCWINCITAQFIFNIPKKISSH